MAETEWERAAEARKEIFRLKWFGQLLKGEHSLGDTFWIGNFGVALVVVPISFSVMLLMTILGMSDQTQVIALSVIAACLAYTGPTLLEPCLKQRFVHHRLVDGVRSVWAIPLYSLLPLPFLPSS